MARLKPQGTGPKARIMLIDDDVDLLKSMVDLFVRDGHEVRSSSNPAEGVQLVKEWKPDLVLLDYCMPGMSGPEVVRAIREFDQMVQVLLVTGYAEEYPPRTLLTELDVQGFHDKTDGPQRLLVLADAALKHHLALMRIDRQRRGLLHIVDTLPKLTRLQPMDELFQVALEQVRPLLGGGDGLLATQNAGLFVFDSAPDGVVIRAGTGRFSGMGRVSQLDAPAMSAVKEGLQEGLPRVCEKQFLLVPMWTREGDRGCVVVEGAALSPEAIELCRIYGQQVAQALENLSLWERATIDGLTRLFNRSFGMQRFEEIRSLDRRQSRCTSVLLVDIDKFKSVNDRYGHAGGDLVLRAVASAVRRTGRLSDVTARWGGEELLMVLPDTASDAALLAAERVRRAVEELRVPFEGTEIRPTISIGCATAGRGDTGSTESLIANADHGLYAAKRAGRNQVCEWRTTSPSLGAA